MPYQMSQAPPGTPEELTLEYLLGKKNDKMDVKALGELSDQERSATGLVQLGQRCTRIPGDPFGVYSAWAGNVGHSDDRHMISACPLLESKGRNAVQRFLAKVLTTEAVQLATESADKGAITMVRNTEEQTTVDFSLASLSVRLMHCKDVDLQQKRPFEGTKRYRDALDAAKAAFDEAPMSIQIQQLVMAQRVLRVEGNLAAALAVADQEEFWLDWTENERNVLRQTMDQAQSADVERLLAVIRDSWSPRWNNGRWDPDFFRHYLADTRAAESAWPLVGVDLLVVTDRHRRVIFATLERAAQLLYGKDLTRKLADTIDMWSFFTPLPLPESKRHVVDRYIRRIHPELDPARAKMAVAHYGCWGEAGHPDGMDVYKSKDSRFTRSANAEKYPESVFPGFCKSVLGHCSEIVRFLVQGVDPEHYSLCRTVYDELPPERRITTSKEDFLSLFTLGINGYTQRHKDTNDMAGGFAGLITLGDYTANIISQHMVGGNLCIPDLGIKVPYAPGACTIIRGDKMDHFVTDFSGPRYFVIGTNHEAVKKYALRQKAQREAQARVESEGGVAAAADDLSGPIVVEGPATTSKGPVLGDEFDDPDEMVGFPLETPCVNNGCDWDEDELADNEWTNEELHEAGALPLYDVSSSDASES
ncbi:hypothetical protein PG993_014117 [Apiospora rasikravindrae]|uniref:Uncharacterized protein n=1 Tax=Apiospora rasikravindrae TaxID=990691 RepID=A0ABR1RS57_9PEZI